MDATDVDRWLARYVAAWKSYDREAIGELFSEDAAYRYHPYDEPVIGRAAIVESWFEEDRLVRLSIKVSTWATIVSLPFGILVAHLLARRDFPGKALLERPGAPAAGAAAGGHRLPAAADLRPARAGRRPSSSEHVRHRLRLPLDRRGARLRRSWPSR